VADGGDKRVSLAALIAVKPGYQPRLIYRGHAAHQQLGGPLVVLWDSLNAHVSAVMAKLIAARDWLTVCRLPSYAHELNPVERVWSVLRRSLANLVKRNLGQLTALARTRLRRMQYQPRLLTRVSWARGRCSSDVAGNAACRGLVANRIYHHKAWR
jgi:transposase